MTPFTRRGSYKHSLPKKAVHRVLYPSMLTEVEWKKKMLNQPRRTAALRIVKQNRFKNFTRNGLSLGSRHQEHHTQTVEELAIVIVRGVLPGLRRRRTGMLPSDPKSSFQISASSYFIWKPRS